jgi:sirohydrochlorin ferrochelatase
VTTGIVVFGHGSRVETANEAVRSVARDLARSGGFLHVEAAFLELGQPDMEGAVVRLRSAGVRQIVIIPYFLTLGTHLERDLPAIVRAIGERHPDLELRVTPPLDGHPGLVRILIDRAAGALKPSPEDLTTTH